MISTPRMVVGEEALGDVPISIFQHTSTDHFNEYITRTTADHTDTDTPLIRPHVRVAGTVPWSAVHLWDKVRLI